jgi:predicted short-subunit dehydrogenase-like oxidoreductase (DUF2520 family)
MNIGFIGAGRLTQALAPALARAGYRVLLPLPLGEGSGEGKNQQAMPHAARPKADQQRIVDESDLVFLAVPDSAIQDVATGLTWPQGTAAAIHASGAFGLELLAAAPLRGAFHPLQTLPGGEASFDGITIAIEASTPELTCALEAMALQLDAKPLTLPPGARPLYHASAALASNYLVGLLSEAATLWQGFGLTREEGLQALLPLVEQTVQNLKSKTPEQALTGPLARGDAATIRKHLQALPSARQRNLYRQLALATLPIARQQGALTAAAADGLASLLQGDD